MLKDGREYGQELLRRKLLCELNVERRMSCRYGADFSLHTHSRLSRRTRSALCRTARQIASRDPAANAAGRIRKSKIALYIIPTDEELMIAHTRSLLAA